MASSLNKVLLIGNLGKDAETRHTQSGTAVVNFPLATTSRYKDQATGDWRERTDWHDVVLWRGDRVAPYLRKGKQVGIEGRLQTRSWEDQNGQKRYKTEVVCDPMGLILLGGREGGGGGYGQAGGRYEGSQGGPSGQGGYGGAYRREEPPPQAPPAPSGAPESVAEKPIDDDDIPF